MKNHSLETSNPNNIPSSKQYDTIVLCADPTGLSAAYHLGDDCLLLEKQKIVLEAGAAQL